MNASSPEQDGSTQTRISAFVWRMKGGYVIYLTMQEIHGTFDLHLLSSPARDAGLFVSELPEGWAR